MRTSAWWCIPFVLAEGQMLLFYCHLDTGFHSVAQTGLELTMPFMLSSNS